MKTKEYNMDYNTAQKLFRQLEGQIQKANELKQPVEKLIKQQISLLENMHDEFISSALKKDPNIESSLDFAGAQIEQLQAIAFLCKKIGIPTDKYDDKIKNIRIKHLGKEFVDEYFKQST